MSMSQPSARSTARSAMVAFDPGRMTRSASPGSGRPGGTMSSATSGSARSGSRSSKLAMRPSSGTAILIGLASSADAVGRRATGILGRQPRAGGKKGTTPRLGRLRAARVMMRETAVEQPHIAAELVDDIALERRRSLSSSSITVPTMLAMTPPRSISPISTTGRSRRLGEAHIGDIAGAQIDLGRAAGALDQHEIGLARSRYRSSRAPWAGSVVFRDCQSAALALPQTLPWTTTCAPVSLCGFSSTGIHMHGGRDAAGPRLQRLGPADLAAVGRHRRIVRHVLRLEGPHGKTARMEGARQPGDDQRLADVGAGALEHDSGSTAHDQNSIPACAFTPARKGCFTMVISVTRSAASISSSWRIAAGDDDMEVGTARPAAPRPPRRPADSRSAARY